MARLHGLDPAALDEARVLEIGCGDGHNLMGLAAAYPRARFEGFDLAETVIRAGHAKAAAAGLNNVSLWVGDILTARERIASGSFDFVIAHGVYAWVPAVVRDAVLGLAAHALADHGVLYISYHALPGGHFRRALRDLLLHEVGDIADPVHRLAAARTVLSELVSGDPQGGASVACLRELAEAALEKPEMILFHDELGEVFAPQSLTETVANAERAGLRYLTDADAAWIRSGFVEDEANSDGRALDRRLVRDLQTQDNRNTCYFRWSLFVRDDAPISRTLDLSIVDSLWASTEMQYDAFTGAFTTDDGGRVTFSQPGLVAALHTIVEAQPGRVALRGMLKDEDWRDLFLRLFANSLIDLHTVPAPFVTTIGERPEASPLARLAARNAHARLPRLDHKNADVADDGLRAVLLATDGQRTVAEIAREVEGTMSVDKVELALQAAAALALIRR